MNIIDRSRSYLAKLPSAIAQQAGHKATFYAACRLVEMGLAFDEALTVLCEWNETHCQPRWTESELCHKLRSAFNRTQPKADFANPGRTSRTVSRALASKPAPTIADSLDVRPFNLTAGSDGERAILAALRHISVEAVALMVTRAQLRFGTFRQRPAWFVMDTRKRFAVARRLDGECWFGDVKAWTISSEPTANGAGVWPIGTLESRNYSSIALVEGGPDFLTAHHFIATEGRQQDCAAVMMFSSSPLIHTEALPHFKGKRVRIFTHADDNGAGEKAAVRWFAQLESCGAVVDCYNCGNGTAKDLNDLARLHDFNEKILP